MSRRGKKSPAEDLMEIVAMLPWWAGVALALLSYLLMHRIANRELIATPQLGEVGTIVSHQVPPSQCRTDAMVVRTRKARKARRPRRGSG